MLSSFMFDTHGWVYLHLFSLLKLKKDFFLTHCSHEPFLEREVERELAPTITLASLGTAFSTETRPKLIIMIRLSRGR